MSRSGRPKVRIKRSMKRKQQLARKLNRKAENMRIRRTSHEKDS